MPRLTPAELDQLKQSVSLVALAESQGHQLKKQGKDVVLLCPFHDEKTPSCVISPAKNLFHCFGCNAAGSVLDWVMQTEKVSYGHALKRLQALNGATPLPASSSTAPPLLIDSGDDGQGLLHQVVEHYHQTLLQHEEALAWLAKRGLHHLEMIAHFKLGFANHSLGTRLPRSKRLAGQAVRKRLAELGILKGATHQEHLRARFIVPVMGAEQAVNAAQRGRVLQLYGRRIVNDATLRSQNSPKHSYLAAPLVGVWNEAALVGSAEAILCEALIDALTFWCAGFRHVLSSFGVHGFSDDHLNALLQHGVKRVLIAYDADEAGNQAAEKLALVLAANGLAAWRVPFPVGMDANEYAVKSGHPTKALGLALQNATPMQATEPVVFQHETPAAAEITLAEPAEVLLLTFGSRQWRVKGWQKNHNSEVMKVTVQLRDAQSDAFHLDSFDLYQAKSRALYIKHAASELGCDEAIIKRELGRVLLQLEQWQAQQLSALTTPEIAGIQLNDAQQKQALALLRDPNLIARVTADLAACGVIGESSNLLAGYLAAVSRKLERPLAVLIQSSSAAGKSSLMEAILSLVPAEERLQYSAMTGQSLYYLGEKNLQHKILAIAEEEGVRQAAYALKLLQSDGELTIASTGKDEQSGELVTKEYKVKGPVMLMLTTTAIDVDEELLNRCLVLTINESREQTEAIHALQRQRQTLAGLLASSEKSYLTELHQNAQRVLRPLHVVNPFAQQLTFLSDKTRTRRDHMKYLTLIQSIALLHQYQREVKRVQHRGQTLEYIEVTRGDIALANKLAHEILGRTLDDMPPQTRKLLLLIQGWVTASSQHQAIKPHEVRFTRRHVREALGWGDTQLKIHLGRLVEMEHLLLFKQGLSYEYGLLWDGKAPDQPHLCGLLDLETGELGQGYAHRSGLTEAPSVASRPVAGEPSGEVNPASSQTQQGMVLHPVGGDENAVYNEQDNQGAVLLSVPETQGKARWHEPESPLFQHVPSC